MQVKVNRGNAQLLCKRVYLCQGSRRCMKKPEPGDNLCWRCRLLADARAGDEEARRILYAEHDTHVYSKAEIEAYVASTGGQ